MGASGSSIAALRAPAVPEGQIGVPGRVLQDSFKRVGAEWAGANVHSGANVHFALAIRQGWRRSSYTAAASSAHSRRSCLRPESKAGRFQSVT